MKILNCFKNGFLIGTVGTFGLTFWKFAHGDDLSTVFFSAFLTTIYFLVFIYLDLKKELK
jgi:hypothetical protein